MEYIQAFVLGIIQGITEFLPISSTAHLLIFTKVFGWKELGAKDFVDAIQFGSVIAIVLYFWSMIFDILKGGIKALQNKDWQSEEWKIIVGIAVGTLPALIFGFLFKDAIPESALVIAIMSIIMALLLGLAEKIGSRKRNFNSLEIRDGILVGLGQTLALIPGASRSGSTLTTALFLGLERDTAAKFSFLLGFPTLTIATLYKSLKIFKEFQNHQLPDNIVPLLIVGIVSTFIFSYLSIAFLIQYLRTKNTLVFVWYRLAFGTTILLSIAAGWKA
ncbi:undecaprenyl-diphosphate phosphatase [Aetokthonos hydrillicola Thurmond2011]|jgi:undecaprenyl-diphosphatase|uniref:Undecaprenyl-diphosphatase n=1 Tax=Aetokthonos hydrillicola Thurmond2011 TaxID=2712845 RepID=A0AAP5MAC4_9CYAN|nr:undecaprenyl-diphosphate phosphatase [Aetokthonos hydrillicola]MBO3457862.1 undecaprenyl-diphosphate phosphatase [Aetokthonos hydrillicola CCALA 1050]MBW4587348.1 undecaprenyl-diphosphate phosphatase [Aetokthonos hydrillicola CCALA 1050]MDR9896627.1 undecaprenyl-diphosphate phosphatase [Aetokthonos hydrillicola Thurmond2011]